MPGSCVNNFDSGSDDPSTCNIMVTWAQAGDRNVFQLTGRPGGSSGYVAMGHSSDASMVSI